MAISTSVSDHRQGNATVSAPTVPRRWEPPGLCMRFFPTAPLLVLAVMLSGLVFGEQAARERVRKQLTEYVGPETAREVNNLMQTARKPAGGRLAATLGGATLLLGAPQRLPACSSLPVHHLATRFAGADRGRAHAA